MEESKSTVEQNELELCEKILYNIYKNNSKRKLCEVDNKTYDVEIAKINCLRLISCGIELNKVEVKQSIIHGKGVFAKVDISIDELITFYPGDIVDYYPNGEVYPSVVLTWNSKRLGKKETYDYHTYACSIDKNYEIIGDPEFEDPSYLGHLINDAGNHDSTEKSIEEYDDFNIFKTNCEFHCCKENLHMAIKAIKNIKEGEELLIQYGSGYWSSHNKRNPDMKHKTSEISTEEYVSSNSDNT